MAIIGQYPILDFSGGVRRDKSSHELQVNELLDSRNIIIDERGRIKTRRGSQQFGQTLSGAIANSYFYSRRVGSGSADYFLTATSTNPSVLSQIIGTKTTASVAVGDATINVTSTTGFAASGTVEIDGDLVSYTGVGAATFTGCTGITSAHVSGAPVHQWSTLTQASDDLDGTGGISFASLGDNVYISGAGTTLQDLKYFDGTTVSNIAVSPSISLITTYRDRIYGVGRGVAAAGSPKRIFYSARGDGTTWGGDYFRVEDQTGERVAALKVYKDRLGIFKSSSIFTYDEIELKLTSDGVGAYNNKSVQEINGVLYTFCPAGVFKTNLSSSQQIGYPVREYWESFVPTVDSSVSPLPNNTFTWASKDSYFIYLGSVSKPTSISDVVLEYNTRANNWVVHTGGFTNFTNVHAVDTFKFGDSSINFRPALFAGDSDGKMWRLNENLYRNTSGTGAVIGGDIYVDRRSNTGTTISSIIETPLYDLGQPKYWKTITDLRVYTEEGTWTVEYRTEDEHGITEYRPLGVAQGTNSVIPIPREAAGWRIGLRFSSVNTNGTSVLNGFVFEDITLTKR